MATKTGHPAVKNPATHDPFPFRFRISHWPEDGEALTLGEIREGLLQQLKERGPNDEDTLYELARTCSFMGRHKEALGYLKEILEHTKDNETLAFCLLALGQVTEKLTDFAAAAAYYRTALSIGCKDKRVWYFFHNNLGYCLNQRGDFKEAETYLQEAIKIDPTRSNAFKNLGLSLQGQGKFAESANLFISAIQANASDARPLQHLLDLVQAHPDLHLTIPKLADQIVACRQAIDYALSRQPDFEANWKKLRAKQQKKSKNKKRHQKTV